MVSYSMVNRCNMCSMMSNSMVSNWCNSMMSNSMVSDWCNSMMCNIMMSNSMVSNSVVSNWCNSMMSNSMVSDTMVGSSMDHSMVRVGVVDSMRYRDGVAVFIKNGLGGVGGDGGAAVNVVPELAAEEVLVKQGAVGADEP